MIHATKAYVRLLLLSMLFLASNAIAASCYDSSPNLADQGEDGYYNIEEPVILSNIEKDQIKSLFEQLHGKWIGQGSHTECFGPDIAPEEKVSKVNLSLKTESNNALHIALNTAIKDLDNGITHQERIDLMGQNPVFSYKPIANNHIVFSEKFRSSSGVVNQNKKRFTRLIENVYEINLTGSHLHFIKNYYINGVFVAQDNWLLTSSR